MNCGILEKLEKYDNTLPFEWKWGWNSPQNKHLDNNYIKYSS